MPVIAQSSAVERHQQTYLQWWQVMEICEEAGITVKQARLMLAHGKSQDEVLSFLANTLTNRLIHAPSQRLRDAAETGDGEIIETIADIYRLDQPHD